jgi:hypothetical protein
MLTQLTKMLFLATFFPMPDAEEEEVGCRLFFNTFSVPGINSIDLIVRVAGPDTTPIPMFLEILR